MTKQHEAVTGATFLLGGLALLVAGFSVLDRLPGWTERWGAVPVYLVYFIVMSVAGRLFWSGADPFLAASRSALTGSPNNRRVTDPARQPTSTRCDLLATNAGLSKVVPGKSLHVQPDQ
jgi:hypothetical protein